jgi:ubiquinone/menaquinone biosynthesis C-methylase UbiE
VSPEHTAADDAEVVALVRDGYDGVAAAYARYVSTPGERPRDAWLERLLERLPAHAAVLELGAGSGVPTAAAMVGRGHRYTGIDISSEQLKVARGLVPDATFVQADFCSISFEAQSFDAVVALYSLTHIRRENYAALLARIRRWLKPDGWVLASFGTTDSAGWLEEDFLGFGGSSWTNSYDVPTTVDLLHDAGFRSDSGAVGVVEQREDWGVERWLFVLAQP